MQGHVMRANQPSYLRATGMMQRMGPSAAHPCAALLDMLWSQDTLVSHACGRTGEQLGLEAVGARGGRGGVQRLARQRVPLPVLRHLPMAGCA